MKGLAKEHIHICVPHRHRPQWGDGQGDGVGRGWAEVGRGRKMELSVIVSRIQKIKKKRMCCGFMDSPTRLGWEVADWRVVFLELLLKLPPPLGSMLERTSQHLLLVPKWRIKGWLIQLLWWPGSYLLGQNFEVHSSLVQKKNLIWFSFLGWGQLPGLHAFLLSWPHSGTAPFLFPLVLRWRTGCRLVSCDLKQVKKVKF